ncbi:hypothetical protein BVX97_02650 [bacterium E08(2017)]|nr:hypothetical protein BVX97_02650 [bacterium E08(2017)]
MHKKSDINPYSSDFAPQVIGKRMARLRKERGYTQAQIAEKTGLKQNLVSDYERSKLRLNADVIIRFCKALNISADELLGLKSPRNTSPIDPLLLKRLKRIEQLPPSQKSALLKTIDTFLKGANR